MIIPRPTDAIHKAMLYRLLTTLADDSVVMSFLKFKGGTCAAMLGYLDRFSVDLDFDAGQLSSQDVTVVRHHLISHIHNLHWEVKQSSQAGIQYFCRYPAPQQHRNTIKIEVSYPAPQANLYQPTYFAEIDRTLPAQTIETMFANKLVAVLDRWERHQAIAGRDIYDIHSFFLQGYRYHTPIIIERRHTDPASFFRSLIDFINQHVKPKHLQQDLNTLLPYEQFQPLHTSLKQETLQLLRDELQRISQ